MHATDQLKIDTPEQIALELPVAGIGSRFLAMAVDSLVQAAIYLASFLLFLLVVLPVFFALRKTRLWLPWLTVASYFFYGWWNPYYLSLVVYFTFSKA